MKILRIFPRKTNATPNDELVRIRQSAPDMFDELLDIDEVHISVAFSWYMASRLKELKTNSLFFAYDRPAELEPLVEAGKMLLNAGFTRGSHNLRCYVLIGYDRRDTPEKCIKRFGEAYHNGFMPMAMLYRDAKGNYTKEWRAFQREWANPIIMAANCKKYFGMD